MGCKCSWVVNLFYTILHSHGNVSFMFHISLSRIWRSSKSNTATPRQTRNSEVSRPLFVSSFKSWIHVFDGSTYPCPICRQLEALDKELQHLSQIKENVDAKVKQTTLSHYKYSFPQALLVCFFLPFKNVFSTQLELRKKQFHVLLSTIQELTQTLDSEKKFTFANIKIPLV